MTSQSSSPASSSVLPQDIWINAPFFLSLQGLQMVIKVLCTALQNNSIYHLNVAYCNIYPTLMKTNLFLSESAAGCPAFGPKQAADRERNI